MDAFQEALAQTSEQGSQMWIDIRAGRFTSSENWKLMESGSRLMTPDELKKRPKTGKGSAAKYIEDISCLSKVTETYIRTKVAETLTGQVSEIAYSHATAWGSDMEPIAAEEYAKRFGVEYEILSFVPWGDHAGGSPDRKIKGDKRLLEIKAPYNSANQINYLMLTDQYDLMREYPEHYWQCVNNMLFTDTEFCDFVTYDHRMKDPKHQMAHIEIKLIPEHIDRVVLKLETAVKEKLALLNLLK